MMFWHFLVSRKVGTCQYCRNLSLKIDEIVLLDFNFLGDLVFFAFSIVCNAELNIIEFQFNKIHSNRIKVLRNCSTELRLFAENLLQIAIL